MQYDGSINIDTKINTSGMNKGTKSISASLKGVLSSVMAVAKTMAAVFIGGSIINGIKSLIGQFDIMGSSIGASVKSLSTSFDALKGAFVNLLLTALAPLIPYVITFVQWLTQLFTIVTQIIGALFGVKAGFGGVASAASGAGKATKKAAKDAAGALAAFDQINVLQTGKDEQPDAGGGGGAGGGLSVPAVDPISPELLAKLEDFKARAGEFFKPLTEALGRLYESLKPLGQTIWAGLQWAWENILVPLGTWVITDLLPAFLDLLAEAAEALNNVLIVFAPIWKEFFDNFLEPLGRFVGDAIVAFLGMVAERLRELGEWIKTHPEKFKEFVQVIQVLGIAFGALIVALWAFVNYGLVIVAAVAAIIVILLNWKDVMEWLKLVATLVLSDILALLKQTGDSIKSGFFSALDAIYAKFQSIFAGIESFVKGSVNKIIDYINGMIANVVNGLNGVIGGLNRVGSVVPGFQAVATVSAPQIPRLATGAVIPPNSEFLAMLGDQKSGTNIEAPADLIRQIIREELGSNGGGSQNINITFGGTMGELVRALKPHIDQENQRVGPSFIQSGANI